MALTAKVVCLHKNGPDANGMFSIAFRADYTDTGNKQWSPGAQTPNMTFQMTVPTAAAAQFTAGSKYTMALGTATLGGSVSASAINVALG